MSPSFVSVLFDRAEDRAAAAGAAVPDCLGDLHLDQIVAAVTTGKGEYDLAPFFHLPLRRVEAIAFRHEVFRDLEHARLLDDLKAFALGMHAVREHLAQLEGRYGERQKDRWFLDAVSLYGDAVNRLARDLAAAPLRSRGLQAFRDFLARYASSQPFTALVAAASRLEAELSAIRYAVLIRDACVEVRHYRGEPDYSAEVEATFERFRQGTVTPYTFKFSDSLEMNHIEAEILEGVARLHPETFARLAHFRATNRGFLDPTVVAFDREIQFYVAYLDHIAPFRKAGLSFCYPTVSDARKEVSAHQAFDLALAGKLLRQHATPVCNDFELKGPERILVVSGPNQGGKTTFARMFGQLHYLASLGCPVPGLQAQLYLADRIFTHFEREEDPANLRGTLEEDLLRMRRILEAATPRSLIIINEIFASTTLQDAVALSRTIAEAILALDVLGVWVTFLDEVATLSEKTVSMVSTVEPDDPTRRTFRIVRRPADGLAYAMALARKYRLSYELLRERLRS